MKRLKLFFEKRGILALLLVIIVIATFLRFYQLGSLPKGFDADEAAYGYNAYSILKTGADEYGKVLPLQLQSFGEYKPALYSYVTIPSILIFGLTPFAVRLPTALFGVASILLLYFLVKKLVQRESVALLSSFLLAISPWHIILSRTTSEVIVSSFFLLGVVYVFLKIKEKPTILKSLIAVIFGILAVFSYTAASFFVIILAGLFLLLTISKKNNKFSINKYLTIIFVTFIVIGVGYSFIGSIHRLNEIDIFHNPQTELVLSEQIREDQGIPVLATRAFHNKIINFTRTIAGNYSQYFTVDFLFLNGGYPFRVRIPDSGLFYIWELPFLLIGIYLVFRKQQINLYFLLLWWLLLLLPASITFDEIPNLYRTLPIIFPMIILISFGLVEVFVFLKKVDKKLLIVVFLLLLAVSLWEFAYNTHQYVVHQEKHQPWYRGYAYQPLIKSVNQYYPDFRKIVMTKAQASPYIYILFFNKYNPKKYQEEGSPRDVKPGGFGKYIFSDVDCPINGGKNGKDTVIGQEGILYIDKGDCVTPLHNVKLLDTIYWQDHNPAFKLFEYISTESGKLKHSVR